MLGDGGRTLFWRRSLTELATKSRWNPRRDTSSTVSASTSVALATVSACMTAR